MKKIKEFLKNKKTIAIVIIVVVIAIGSSITVYAATSSNKVKYDIVKTNFTFEYGDDVKITAGDVIKYDKKELDPKINLDLKKDSKSYVPVGKYTGSITLDKENVKFNVTVKDTVAPEFTDKVESINLDRESQEDITSKFKATDLSGDVKITAGDFDRNTAGTYEVQITAEDSSKNKETLKVNVIVDQKTTAEKQAEDEAAAAAQAQAEAEAQQSNTSNNTNNNTSNNTNNNTNGSSTTPSNSGGTTPVSEPVVQLTPTPLGSPLFDSEDAAIAWANSIWNDPKGSSDFASKFGYTYITNWYNSVVYFGYKSTGTVVYTKDVIVFTFQ